MGYELFGEASGIFSPPTSFFVGELAFYFFACLPCRRVVVVSQPVS